MPPPSTPVAHQSLGCLDLDVSADAQVSNVVPLYVNGKTHLDPVVVATSEWECHLLQTEPGRNWKNTRNFYLTETWSYDFYTGIG